MSRDPRFDELLDGEALGAERERLRRAHELLVQAGPPPELPPGLADARQLDGSPRLPRRRLQRRATLLLAAALAVLGVFFAGYAVGHHGGAGGAAGLALKGTAATPHAHATLEVLPETAGNVPMKLTVAGLPKLPAHTYYDVYLVRKGEYYLSCGTFVTAAGGRPLTVTLNAPYRLQHGDWWVITRHAPSTRGRGPVVLRPA